MEIIIQLVLSRLFCVDNPKMDFSSVIMLKVKYLTATGHH